MAMTPRLYSISGLATEIGKDRRTIAAALRETKPDGKIGRFDAWRLDTALEALAGNSSDADLNPAQEKARLDRARADIAELDLAAKRGEYVPVDGVHELLANASQTVRTKLLAMPSRVAPLIRPSMKVTEIEAVVHREVDDVLKELRRSMKGNADESD